MIKDYQLKKVVAEMKRQVNAAAKKSDREGRITFVLVHMLSEHHDLADAATKPDGENNLFRFVMWFLSQTCDELEVSADSGYDNPIDIYRNNEEADLFGLFRFRTPAKDAVSKGLDEKSEWPDDVPHNDWIEDALQTAYATLFGLYYFDTPTKDLMRWIGKDEPKNPRFVNAMNRQETVININADKMQMYDSKEPKEKKEKVYISDDEYAKGIEQLSELRDVFRRIAGMLAKGDTERFCREKEDTAFGVFMIGTFTMMIPGENVNRDRMMASDHNAGMVYQIAKKTMMGKKLVSQIQNLDDDKAAQNVFLWGLEFGRQGVTSGFMPTGMADVDIRRKPGPKKK